MTPEELIDAWNVEAEALRQFFGAQPMIPGWGRHHTEAFSKFKRAGMALQKFRTYEVDLAARGIEHSDDIEPLGFYADAFYYFAWRFVRLLRLAKARRSDGLTYQPFRGFDSGGVRRARNQMLEHTEKDDGVPDLQTLFFSPNGWVMASHVVDEHGMPIDPGLYPNAEQLIIGLRRRLAEASAATRPGGGN